MQMQLRLANWFRPALFCRAHANDQKKSAWQLFLALPVFFCQSHFFLDWHQKVLHSMLQVYIYDYICTQQLSRLLMCDIHWYTLIYRYTPKDWDSFSTQERMDERISGSQTQWCVQNCVVDAKNKNNNLHFAHGSLADSVVSKDWKAVSNSAGDCHILLFSHWSNEKTWFPSEKKISPRTWWFETPCGSPINDQLAHQAMPLLMAPMASLLRPSWWSNPIMVFLGWCYLHNSDRQLREPLLGG